MHTALRDLRYAVRQLSKTPGFALAIILALALGIGATTAIFSLVEGILLRPLPFVSPDHLVILGDHVGDSPGIGVTAREIGDYARISSAFASMGGYATQSYELSGGATPEEVDGARFNAGVFTTLGVQPVLGRVFTQAEEDAHQPLAVISYALWLNRYHRDPHVPGRAILLDRKTYTIIGVMPRSFDFPVGSGLLDQTQVWVPLSLTPEELSDQNVGAWGYHMVARLRDGVTARQAAEDAERVGHEIMRNFPASMAAIRIRGDVDLLQEHLVADSRPLLRTLLLAVLSVLLIACVNVAGLLLVRAIRRQREYAVRLALGAGSSAIIRSSLFEGILLSLAGGILGLAVDFVAIRTSLRFLPDSMPRVDSISIDATVAAFAILLAIVTGAACSFAPALAALRTNLTESLKESARGASGTAGHGWLRSSLIVTQIAVALVLLNTSVAFLRSFEKMHAVDPGFRPDHVLSASYELPLNQYSTTDSENAFDREVIKRLSGKPGVVAAGVTDTLPANDSYRGSSFTIEGERSEGWKLKFAEFSIVDGDYFAAMGIPLLDGRTFTVEDRANSPLVVIVNETMAKQAWPNQEAVGKRMHAGNPKKGYPWATVVGVVADTKPGSRDEPAVEQFYAPALQPATLYGTNYDGKLSNSGNLFVVMRSAMPAEQMPATLRATVAEVDPLLALQHVQSMDDAIANVEAPRRFNTDLVTAFALAALLLTTTGIYAVVAFSVSLRVQEIAIRMALGAQREGIVRLVLTTGAKLAFFGCCLGILGSLAASRLIASFLFGVGAAEPAIYVASVCIMVILAILASALPAVRAASVDPVKALRLT